MDAEETSRIPASATVDGVIVDGNSLSPRITDKTNLITKVLSAASAVHELIE